MIELSWKEFLDRDEDAMMYVANLLAWLTTTLATTEENKHLKLNGFVVLLNKEKTISTLILCNDDHQKEIYKILQQPPEEYKERYVACITCEEPSPVVEVHTDIDLQKAMKDDDDSGQLVIETEET